MSTAEERLKILNMIAEGKITAEEGSRLLSALQGSKRKTQSSTDLQVEPRYLRVRVSNTYSGKEMVNVTIPITLVNVAMRLGARFAPDLDAVDFDEVLEAIRGGMRGKIVDVHDEAEGEHVEIFVE